MKLRTLLIVLCLATVSGATAVPANLKTLHGQLPANAWAVTALKGCSSFDRVTGCGTILPAPIPLYSDDMGAIGATVRGEAGYRCGTSTGTAYHHAAMNGCSGTQTAQ